MKAVKRKEVSKKTIKKVVIKYYKTNIVTYCLVCKRNAENKDAKMVRTGHGRLMLSSKCAICGSQISRFMKEQEAKALLGNLGNKTTLSKIPLLGNLLI